MQVDKSKSDLLYIVGLDLMCFEADAKTLEPLGISWYDAYAIDDPPKGYKGILSVNAFNEAWLKKNKYWILGEDF